MPKETATIIHVHTLFTNLLRPRSALIVPFDGQTVVLGTKGYLYDLPRLIGGGIEPDETPLAGAVREFKEETDQTTPLKPLCTIPIHAIAKDGQTADLTVYCFTTPMAPEYTAHDDLLGTVMLPLEELQAVAEKMALLPDQWMDGYNGRFNWQDWGALYSLVHKQVYRALTRQSAYGKTIVDEG